MNTQKHDRSSAKGLIEMLFAIKVEKFLKGSLDLIQSPSPPVKIQIVGWKVCLRY